MKYVAIVGTNASFSYNRKLLWYMKKHFNAQAQIEVQEITDVPLFSEDYATTPARVNEIARAIEESDGVIFSTPEYDHSITAGLKSLIEWLSWGKHPLTNTPVMIVGTSLGQMGTVFAQQNLREILSSPGIDAFVLPSNQFLLGRAPKSFNEHDELTDERTIGFLEACFNNFMLYSQTVKSMRDLAQDRTGKALVKKEKTVQTLHKAAHILEKGDGWWIEKINLGFPISDAETGSSKKETHDAKTGASKAEHAKPVVLAPKADAHILDKGEGWWIEKVALTTGASKSEADTEKSDSETGASKH